MLVTYEGNYQSTKKGKDIFQKYCLAFYRQLNLQKEIPALETLVEMFPP